ncbi:MAG: Ribosomal-protein-S18p-alanine acetyltransferase, partial [uncultured Solirubrobacteraceae bacterium]
EPAGRDPSLDLRRPAPGHRRRAPRVPYPLVAGDVRPRALQAQRDLPGRMAHPRRRRGRGPVVRLPHLLALRHGLARHERLGRSGGAPRGNRHRAAGVADRADRRPGGAVHAGGPRVERPGDPPVRTLRLPDGRPPAPLLRRQPGGRPDHVAHAHDAPRQSRGRPPRRTRHAVALM